MQQFIAKFKSDIEGVLSGFDRVLFRGSLRRLTHSLGMKWYLSERYSLQTVRRRCESSEPEGQEGDAGAAREETNG
jgi:hypothetical protein